ncbi:hypothetical protein EVAR_5215_1 [Eumeta japonica]|uniref:Sushi domain-containing protein n=1 Tax=Eumeta variegata TaxID=151549 RepID=A0A4C1V403_EUMVA|nr:hypothetical protein EVAR_5215_1 [Eumeta japonica]
MSLIHKSLLLSSTPAILDCLSVRLWARVRRSLFELNRPTKYACTLPPYPDNGGYDVVDQPDARPGDTFQQVTLVRYTTEERNQLREVKVLSCSYGEWFEKKQQRKSNYRYFNASSCPLSCPGPTNGLYLRHLQAEKVHVERNSCGTNYLQPVQTANEEDFPKYMYRSWITDPSSVTTTVAPENAEKNDAARGRPIIVEWERDARHSAGLSLVREQMNYCYLPKESINTRYDIETANPVKDGEGFEALYLRYSCEMSNYTLTGNPNIYCFNGVWNDQLPKCVELSTLACSGSQVADDRHCHSDDQVRGRRLNEVSKA